MTHQSLQHVELKGRDTTSLTPIHPVRSTEKVRILVEQFDLEQATPILVGKNSRLLNGTHRYQAYLTRLRKGYSDNFKVVFLDDLDCWVGDAIREYLCENTETMYIDIDHFWNDNWLFSDCSK